ncbi:MAG: hypothetical protein QNL59_04835 [Actinomycetota bacterium]
MALTNQSWMLDAIAFHHDFEDRLRGPEGLVAVRDRAVQLWDGVDPVVHDYLATLVVSSPEDWYRACEDTYLVDWYRVLMAPWLTPTRSIQFPDALRRGLPQLGWHATESRRLARGRELLTLAERHLSGDTFEQLLSRFGWGQKGWLDIDDVTGAITRLRRLDPQQFRRYPDLVSIVENAFEVFESAATKPDHVLLTVAD